MENNEDMSVKESLNIILGYVCNYKCSYCSVLKDVIKNIHYKFTKKDLDNIDECIEKNNIKDISILGGEPFLFRDVLYILYDHIYKKYPKNNINFRIITNATLMNEFDFKYLNRAYLKISVQSLNGKEKSIYHLIKNNKLGYKIIDEIRKFNRYMFSRVILLNEKEWYKDIININKVFPGKNINIAIDTRNIKNLNKESIDNILNNYRKIIYIRDAVLGCVDIDYKCTCSDINIYEIGKGFIYRERPKNLVVGCNEIAKDLNKELFDYLVNSVKEIHKEKFKNDNITEEGGGLFNGD